MALRDLKCTACGFEFEEIVKELSDGRICYRGPDEEPVRCPKCSSTGLERKEISHGTGFALKGFGWTGKLKKS